MATDLTTDELLEALRQALDVPDDSGASTMPELAVKLGIGERQCRRAMHRLNNEGRLQVVKVPRKALDGRIALVPAYRIKAAP